MKKWLSLLLAVMLCAACSCGAAAAAPEIRYTFTKGYASDTRINFIENSNFLADWGADEDAYQRRILTASGIPLNDELYGIIQYGHGFFAVQDPEFKTGGMGLIDEQGNEIAPMDHWEFTILNNNWAKGTNWYVLEDGGEAQYTALYDLAKGELIGEIDENLYRVGYAVGDVLNFRNMETGEFFSGNKELNILGVIESMNSEDYAQMPNGVRRVRENRLWGLKDLEGNWVLSPQFESMNWFYRGYAVVKDQGLMGVIAPTGQYVVEPKYESIETTTFAPYDTEAKTATVCAEGYFTAVKDGKIVFIDEESGEVFETGVAKESAKLYGASLKYTAEDGTEHLLSADGVDTPLSGYEDVYALSYQNGRLISASDKDDNTFILDWHGNVVLEIKKGFINSVSGDGSMIVAEGLEGGCSVLHMSEVQDELKQTPAQKPVLQEKDVRGFLNDLIGGLPTRAPQATPEPEQPASANPVATMVDTAILLLEADAAANQAQIATLIEGAQAILGDTNRSASVMLNSAATLLEVNAAESAPSIIKILETAKESL